MDIWSPLKIALAFQLCSRRFWPPRHVPPGFHLDFRYAGAFTIDTCRVNRFLVPTWICTCLVNRYVLCQWHLPGINTCPFLDSLPSFFACFVVVKSSSSLESRSIQRNLTPHTIATMSDFSAYTKPFNRNAYRSAAAYKSHLETQRLKASPTARPAPRAITRPAPAPRPTIRVAPRCQAPRAPESPRWMSDEEVAAWFREGEEEYHALKKVCIPLVT